MAKLLCFIAAAAAACSSGGRRNDTWRIDTQARFRVRQLCVAVLVTNDRLTNYSSEDKDSNEIADDRKHMSTKHNTTDSVNGGTCFKLLTRLAYTPHGPRSVGRVPAAIF